VDFHIPWYYFSVVLFEINVFIVDFVWLVARVARLSPEVLKISTGRRAEPEK
jgi:hypothetical protein